MCDKTGLIITTIIGAVIIDIAFGFFLHVKRKRLAGKRNDQSKQSKMHLATGQSLLFVLILIETILILRLVYTEENKYVIAAIGTFLGWLFKDYLRGAITYAHLRFTTGRISPGDWIEIPDKNVDGEIDEINLLSITINNWDNTQTVLPTYMLQEGAMKNWHVVTAGSKGRRILQTYSIDNNSIQEMDLTAIAALKEEMIALSPQEKVIPWEQGLLDNGQPATNIEVFRRYLELRLRHYQPIVAKDEKLIIRLLDPTPQGIPLQVYVFISTEKKLTLTIYEQEKSRLEAFILMRLPLFGLRLFQETTGSDINQIKVLNPK